MLFDNEQQHQLYDAVLWWQRIELFKPLICIEASHRPLEATLDQHGQVGLFCQDCSYTQLVDPALAGMLLASYAEKETFDEITRFQA